MPLNYSKWDQLELSDDSDIEGHPNVDKRSLVRALQNKKHEEREMRKHKIASLKAEIACNDVLLPRIKTIHASLLSPPDSKPVPVYFNEIVEKLATNPSSEAPPSMGEGMTYDGMILSLLRMVAEEGKKKVSGGSVDVGEREEKLGQALVEGLATHMVKLPEAQDHLREELAKEEKEQKKHITSDDMHDGFENKYVPPKPEPPPVSTIKDKPKKTTNTTEIEVLNPKAATAAFTAPATEEEQEEADDLPDLTPSLEAFSQIPLRAYEQSFQFIQSHRDVVVPGASDALLVAAFRAQSNGKAKYAKQCVHQSLLLQYCEKLGGDGVRVFFRKMVSGDKRAETVFVDDLENTYKHLCDRVEISLKESEAYEGREQIQLVPENPNQTISFNIPDGPPPENLVLEGEGTEKMDIEEVRKALQLRWDVYEAFPDDLKTALKGGKLDDVNKVLGEMEVPEAEEVVQRLDLSGILNFAEGGIRDETGK